MTKKRFDPSSMVDASAFVIHGTQRPVSEPAEAPPPPPPPDKPAAPRAEAPPPIAAHSPPKAAHSPPAPKPEEPEEEQANINVLGPRRVLENLRIRATKRRTTVRALVLEALRAAGYFDDE